MNGTSEILAYDPVKDRDTEFNRRIARAKGTLKRMGPMSTEALLMGLFEVQWFIDMDAWKFNALLAQNDIEIQAVRAKQGKAMAGCKDSLDAAQASIDPMQKIKHMDRYFKLNDQSNKLYDEEQRLWNAKTKIFDDHRSAREKRDRAKRAV